jgi:hypothetical protein
VVLTVVIDTLVEGVTDEAVARKLIEYTKHSVGTGYGKHGKDYLKKKAWGFNERASYGNPILMLVDFMDTGLACAPEVVTVWLPDRSPKMLFRVVVRELESWLLADTKRIASYLKIAETLIPNNPEKLPDPKQTLVNLARRSRLRKIREAMIPATGVSTVVGPAYTAAVEEFVIKHWNVDSALNKAPSLQSCINRLRDL